MNKQEKTALDESSENLSKEDFKTKIDNSGRRSKIHIKLNKRLSEAYATFNSIAKPEGMSDEDFASTIFMLGMDVIQKQLMSHTEEETENEDGSSDTKVI